MIETDRLLELIDQFAAAEGRMKWAPNKKLHFEVAVIKAIQTLSQVTLNEVIENLSALRDGKTPTRWRRIFDRLPQVLEALAAHASAPERRGKAGRDADAELKPPRHRNRRRARSSSDVRSNSDTNSLAKSRRTIKHAAL